MSREKYPWRTVVRVRNWIVTYINKETLLLQKAVSRRKSEVGTPKKLSVTLVSAENAKQHLQLVKLWRREEGEAVIRLRVYGLLIFLSFVLLVSYLLNQGHKDSFLYWDLKLFLTDLRCCEEGLWIYSFACIQCLHTICKRYSLPVEVFWCPCEISVTRINFLGHSCITYHLHWLLTALRVNQHAAS